MTGLINNIGSDGTLSVVIPTILNIARDALQYWQGMTCFFDKYWYPEADVKTLPFCFFHVLKYSEIDKAERSQKRVILYEPPESDNAQGDLRDPVRPGLMQTITDNIVIQPREYKMEIVVPFTPFGRYVRQGADVMKSVLGTLTSGLGYMTPADAATIGQKLEEAVGRSKFAGNAERAFGLYDDVFNEPVQGTGYNEENIITISNEHMINKNSLDSMFRRGSIIQMKTWMGFDYKYVVITDKVSEKRSTEDDVWRVEITCAEMPVLSLAPVTGTVQPVNRTWTMPLVDRIGEFVYGQPNKSSEVPALVAAVQNGSDEAEPTMPSL